MVISSLAGENGILRYGGVSMSCIRGLRTIYISLGMVIFVKYSSATCIFNIVAKGSARIPSDMKTCVHTDTFRLVASRLLAI